MMRPYAAWQPHVVWHAETMVPMAIGCCHQQFAITDPATMIPDEDVVGEVIDHAMEVHGVPAAIAADFLVSLPQIALKLRVEQLMGTDNDDEED